MKNVCVSKNDVFEFQVRNMQPTSRVGGFEVGSPTIEPTDVFCGLASLIVEGRMPKNDRRGYGEGPHVPPPVTKPLSSASRHECSEENNLVSNISHPSSMLG